MWTDLLPTLLLLLSIAVQAQLPPMPKSALFTQIACDSITQTRLNQLALFDANHKNLGTVFESCSLISGPCKIEGLGNITVGPYTVVHPGAFFGTCLYKNVQIEITATDGFNTVRQQLFATCELSPFLCQSAPDKPTVGELHEVKISEFPVDFEPTSVVLQEYNRTGCLSDQDTFDEISTTGGCQLLTTPGITSVVVVPKPDMPSTCILTLFADTNCFSPNNPQLGPITPGSNPGSCIGPILNQNGTVFVPQAATLKC
ncbi:hypothetical protein B9Z19DRAFT_1134355 [Tuber borchii]|uniref:Ubiquitin 3 binding protein But2 C-terminal domain-domain-containing protein n=1 Tax=Tuber borchii TaxID=42251 RepID=A0A2T6ZEB6_TUBBO|nr:hypothetical protein B9Z19DRAFT_1134355 [Tuber borchii]